MRHVTAIYAAALLASLTANFVQWQRGQADGALRPYTRRDEAIVAQAIAMWTEEAGAANTTEAMRFRTAVAARDTQKRCVNLITIGDVIGRVPIYCFDDNDRLIGRAWF